MPSLRPSFTTVLRRLRQWTDELASVPDSANQSFTYSLPQCPPYTFEANDQVSDIELYPHKQKINAATSSMVQQATTDVHHASLNSIENASRPSLTSPGLPYSVNYFNVSMQSSALTIPCLQNSYCIAPGPLTVNYFHHQPDMSTGVIRSLNASTLQSSSMAAGQKKVSSRTSNNSSRSSASDSKAPRWPGVSYSLRDTTSYEELETKLTDFANDDTLPLPVSRTSH
jgi:hypothetical protein